MSPTLPEPPEPPAGRQGSLEDKIPLSRQDQAHSGQAERQTVRQCSGCWRQLEQCLKVVTDLITVAASVSI